MVRRTVRCSDSGKQNPQIIINLGYRPDGGTGIVAGRFLIDRNGR